MSAIVAAFSLGAAALAKGALSEAGKDAYLALKKALAHVVSSGDVEKLEENPNSAARKGIVAEELDGAKKADDPELARLAEHLVEALKESGSVGSATGISLEDVEAVNVRLKRITSSGTGISIKRSKFEGDIEAEDVSAGGQPPGKPERK